MISIKKMTLLLAIALFSTTAALAQQPQTTVPASQQQEIFSDKELKQFATAYQQIQFLSQGMQQKIMAVIQDKGINAQLFNEMHQSNMDPNQEMQATPEEKEKYASAIREIEKMQAEFDGQISNMLKEQNFSIDDYQKIAAALQTNQKLQMRMQKIMQE